jgi:predicted DNA-binding protein
MYMVEQVDVITVKIPREVKKQMKQVNVNWSQYIRECVQKKINQEKMKIASQKLDEIRKDTKPTSTEEIVSWIREDRER